MYETETVGRPIFDQMSPLMVATFYIVAVVATAIFAYGLWRRVAKYRRGKKSARFPQVLRQLSRGFGVIASHSRLRRGHTVVGLAHAAMFFGFIVLFAGTVTITIDHDIVGLIAPEFRFWRGNFYLWFSLILDLFGAALLIGLLIMAWRRWAVRPAELNYTRPDRPDGAYDRKPYRVDDAVFFWALLIVVVTGFIIEAVRILAYRPPFEVWSVVGWHLANLLEAAGLTAEDARAARPYLWWAHAIIALGFIAYIPYAKSVHMLASLGSLLVRDMDAGRQLSRVEEEQGAAGYGAIADFSWAELLQLDACTKCGRCHSACPARAGGFPLSPRDLVLELRENANATFGGISLFGEVSKTAGTAFGISEETLWSCTTCMACVDICPVGVEHVPMIVQMRRRLVENGSLETNIQATLERLATTGNSFGAPENERGAWAAGLEAPVVDARTRPVEYLWFVGDYASFDPRAQRISRSAARVFQAIGLDFGILFESERNAGNDVRRIGEEGLYQYLVEQNLASLASTRYRRIVTTDPHSYNTLRREYPDLNCEVLHHTELLAKLFAEGRLPLKSRIDRRVTYHDPCHLSRYNGVVGAPRDLLKALGVDLVEMERHGANSFCCGAGGGRIWMAGRGKGQRPSEARIEEALRLENVSQFVTACPKCNVMHSEAVKAVGAEKQLEVIDIVELVEESLFERPPESLADAAAE